MTHPLFRLCAVPQARPRDSRSGGRDRPTAGLGAVQHKHHVQKARREEGDDPGSPSVAWARAQRRPAEPRAAERTDAAVSVATANGQCAADAAAVRLCSGCAAAEPQAAGARVRLRVWHEPSQDDRGAGAAVAAPAAAFGVRRRSRSLCAVPPPPTAPPPLGCRGNSRLQRSKSRPCSRVCLSTAPTPPQRNGRTTGGNETKAAL